MIEYMMSSETQAIPEKYEKYIIDALESMSEEEKLIYISDFLWIYAQSKNREFIKKIITEKEFDLANKNKI
jgi:hypothetical protein